jgi:glycosyltransferase involved in cell wall biosynthesis
MLACGLPCADLASASSVAAFGPDTPVLLAPPTPPGLADGLARLLDDPDERARRSREGLATVAPLTWERTGEQVEAGLRRALEVAGAA